jgi:Cu(I)/Ag(I) efflux system membrane protein CusA/SilA
MRVRPLLMTVFTTFFGLLPLMFSTGTGAQVMKRLATPMVGGLFSATLLTLVVLPAAYVFVRRSAIQSRPASRAESERDEEQPVPLDEGE